MKQDFNTGCPKCRCVVFDKTKGVVLRSVHFKSTDMYHIYQRGLVRCAGCGSLIQIVDDNRLEIIELDQKETSNAVKP